MHPHTCVGEQEEKSAIWDLMRWRADEEGLMYRSTAMEDVQQGKGPEDVFVLIIIYGSKSTKAI